MEKESIVITCIENSYCVPDTALQLPEDVATTATPPRKLNAGAAPVYDREMLEFPYLSQVGKMKLEDGVAYVQAVAADDNGKYERLRIALGTVSCGSRRPWFLWAVEHQDCHTGVWAVPAGTKIRAPKYACLEFLENAKEVSPGLYMAREDMFVLATEYRRGRLHVRHAVLDNSEYGIRVNRCSWQGFIESSAADRRWLQKHADLGTAGLRIRGAYVWGGLAPLAYANQEIVGDFGMKGSRFFVVDF